LEKLTRINATKRVETNAISKTKRESTVSELE